MTEGGTESPRMAVREMTVDECQLRMAYFHDADDQYLELLGVERRRLPSVAEWRTSYAEQLARPVDQRDLYAVVWELDGVIVGFSTADRIDRPHHAFVHLHLLEPGRRGGGLGARFMVLSAAHYFEVLHVARLFSEPRALNVAPHRTLQRAGFRFVLSHETRPGPINALQITTRWVLERPGSSAPGP